jgi:hypothetical protein
LCGFAGNVNFPAQGVGKNPENADAGPGLRAYGSMMRALYHPQSDRRSWAAMKMFFDEALA